MVTVLDEDMLEEDSGMLEGIGGTKGSEGFESLESCRDSRTEIKQVACQFLLTRERKCGSLV
jgi:hypothetical protein